MITKRSTSLSGMGTPYAYEPKRMILKSQKENSLRS